MNDRIHHFRSPSPVKLSIDADITIGELALALVGSRLCLSNSARGGLIIHRLPADGIRPPLSPPKPDRTPPEVA